MSREHVLPILLVLRVLWVVTLAINRATGIKPTDPAIEIGGPGPVN